MHADDLAVEDGRAARAVEDSSRRLDGLAVGGGFGGGHVLRLGLADNGGRQHHNVCLSVEGEEAEEGGLSERRRRRNSKRASVACCQCCWMKR
jgi:hypothetical protein